jgi:hypothetical protein
MDDADSIEAKAKAEFHQALGEAIASWAWVEHELFHVYLRAVRPMNVPALARSFQAIINFNSRLAMVTAAVGTTDHASDWKKLENTLLKKSKARNKLAHLTVYVDRAFNVSKDKVWLGEPLLNMVSGHEVKRINTLGMVKELRETFERLVHDLEEFVERFPLWPPRPV